MDKVADEFVKKAAQFFWKNDPHRKRGESNRYKKMPDTLSKCISYLEEAFPVTYDARYSSDLVNKPSDLLGMSPKNHHLLSLAHCPDIIGLIFSEIDQFYGAASFIGRGKLITVVPERKNGLIPYLQGSTLPSMLFCGFVNWLGHLISDIAGSSSTRTPNKSGRGAGIPIPFYELFLVCNFGNIDGMTLAETMIKVYEEGYDARFGATMAIPVFLEDIMIKAIWMIRQKLIRKKSWSESFPSDQHRDLRIMLIVGQGTFCVVDGADAAVRGFVSENVVVFICHLNLVGWIRLVSLVLKELAITYVPRIESIIKQFINDTMEILTTDDKKTIASFLLELDEIRNDINERVEALFHKTEEEFYECYIYNLEEYKPDYK